MTDQTETILAAEASDYGTASGPIRSVLDLFSDGYIDAMLWANGQVSREINPHWETGPDGWPIVVTEWDSDYGDAMDEHAADCPESVLAEMRADAEQFARANAELLQAAVESDAGYGWDSAGHDFALTRNRHGAGFWDRGIGDVGDELTELAHAEGESYVWLGIDHNGTETWGYEN